MMKKISQLDDVLEKLSTKEAEADMGGGDTSHPSADVDNNTKDNNLEGARSSENVSDNKEEQPIGVEDTGSPEVKDPAGSQGVEAKEPDESGDEETGDNTGVSEQLDKDTSHASANGEKRGGLDQLIDLFEDLAAKEAGEKTDDEPEKKADDADDKTEPEAKTDDDADDKTAEEGGAEGNDKAAGDGETDAEVEKLAEHIEKVAEEHPDAVEAGYKFGAYVLEQIKTAAEAMENSQKMFGMLKEANIPAEQAMGMAPDMGLEEGAGEDDVLSAVADALAAEGIAPEELEALLTEAGGAEAAPEMGGEVAPEAAPEMGGEAAPMGGEADPLAGAGEDEQIAALEAALGETGTSPEELAAAAAGEGADETVQEEAKVGSVLVKDLKPGTEKFAAIIADNPEKAVKLAALKDKCVEDLKAIKSK